jgi:ATP-dependent DNA helicase RecG
MPVGRVCCTIPAAPASRARGSGKSGPQLAELAKLDSSRPADVDLHLPLRYEDETRLTRLRRCPPG